MAQRSWKYINENIKVTKNRVKQIHISRVRITGFSEPLKAIRITPSLSTKTIVGELSISLC